MNSHYKNKHYEYFSKNILPALREKKNKKLLNVNY